MKEDTRRNLDNFMRNPSIVGRSEKYKFIMEKNKLIKKYNEYMATHETLPYTVYLDKGKDLWLYHFNIESSADPEVIYDVVIEFDVTNPRDDKIIRQDPNLKNYEIRLFSNSPGFTFTYAYAYNHHKILIPSLAKKFPEKVLKEKPTRNNPEMAIGYDYAIFFVLYFLHLNDYHLRKAAALRRAKPITEFNTGVILTSDEAMEKRTEASRSLIKRLEKEIQRNVVKPVQAATDNVKKAATRMVSKVPFVKNTGIVKPVKATSPRKAIHAVKTTRRISKK